MERIINRYYVGSKRRSNTCDSEWKLPMEDFEVPRLSCHTPLDIARIVKYLGSKIFVSMAGILLTPLFVLLGIMIKLDSKGPVFFKQERIGLAGKKFRMLKFRTMIHDAEKQKADLMKYNQASGPVFKIDEDPRITRIGVFLRRTGMDELPQLINVIQGHMTLIGPRPPLESEVRQYKKWQMRRLTVIPGITCTWQISPNRHAIEFDEWMKMDLDYIDSWSLKKDASIFIGTVKSFLVERGH